MKCGVRGFGLLVVGWALGHPAPVQAQTPAVKLEDVVGMWEASPELLIKDQRSDSGLIYEYVTIHSDTTTRIGRIRVFRGDTLFCGSSPWLINVKELLQDMGISKDPDGVQRLSWFYINRSKGKSDTIGAEVYKRIDSPKPQFAQVIATGFATGRPIPAHPQTPTGTFADVLGMWEVTGPSATTKFIQIFRPDTTRLEIEIYVDEKQKETLVCGVGSLASLQRIGDTILQVLDGRAWGHGYILQNQQLASYEDKRFFPENMFKQMYPKETKDQVQPSHIYKPVDAPKRP